MNLIPKAYFLFCSLSDLFVQQYIVIFAQFPYFCVVNVILLGKVVVYRTTELFSFLVFTIHNFNCRVKGLLSSKLKGKSYYH